MSKRSMYIYSHNCIICMYVAGRRDGFFRHEDQRSFFGNVLAGIYTHSSNELRPHGTPTAS